MAEPFARAAPDGVRLVLRVTPNAGADRVEGVETRADGQQVLRLRVGAVPDKGRANAAVIALLAAKLGLQKSAITLVSGQTARTKIVLLRGDPPDLLRRLSALTDGAG